MAIDENDAFQVFKGIETMPEEMRPRAASLLADYKTQQESAGAPLWPTQEKIKQDRRKRVQEVFDNPLVLDADNGAFVEANKVKPGIGDNLRSREASILWLADRYNADEADVRKRYDFYKADQSQKWGHQTLDDATFFNKAKADNDAEIVRTDKRKQATLTGIESALSGASMASELGRFLEAYPDSTEEEKLTFASTLAQTTGVLAPHKRLIDSAAPAMRRIQKGEATDSDMQTVEELAWTLAQSQGRDRQILMRSLLMGAKKVAEEGGKRDVSGTFAGSALNLIEGMYGSGRRGEDVARRIDPSQPLPIGEPITSVQDALKAMDAMARADIASRVPYDPNAPELPAFRVLSDEEKDFVIEAKDRVKSLFKTERELKKIALSTDPMDDSIMGTMASGSASSLSLMLPLAMGPQGLLMAGGGYANMEREELLTEFPDMDPGDASRIAVLSGAVQAAGDKAALFGLYKFAPNVRKMIVGGVTKELIKKAAIQGTAVFVFENTVEAAQDLSTSVIQTMVADLKATVPQVDWQKERDEFLGTRADVAIGMVPLMLLGAGVNTAANKQQINQMLSDNDLLMRAGIIQEDRVKILELSTAGKTDEAQAWLKDSMGRRSPELAAEVAERYASKMEVLRKTQDQAITLQTTSPEYTASVTRTPSGWQVTTGDGTIIPVESAEAARRIAVDLRQVGSQQEADALVNVIDGYYAAGKRVDTVFTGEDVKASETVGVVATRRDANNALLSQRQFGPQALETVRAEAEIAGIKSDTRNIFAHVNGSNEAFPMRVADGAKGVTRILNLYRSQEESQPQVITFLHENIESSWRLGMANSTFSEQETRTAFSALLPAFEGIQTTDALELQFIDNVRQLAAGKGNDTMMRETVSEMVVRDVLGRDRDGRATGMKPGSISRAIEASVMGANTQEQVSALKSILAAIKAFTAYLKAVFSTVDAISTARDEGKLGEDWIGFVDKVLGIDEVKRDEGLAMNEAQAILEDSDMPFSISPADTVIVNGNFFENPNSFYRVIQGDEALSDVIQSGEVRTNATTKIKEGMTLAEKMAARPTAFPSFSKGSASMSYAAENPNHSIIVSNDKSMQPSTSGRHSAGRTYFPTVNGIHQKSLSNNFQVYKHIGSGEYALVYKKNETSQSFSVSVPTSDIDTIPEDLSRAEADMKAGGKDWAAKVDLSQPVGVYRGEDGRLKLFDGHHRWLAARERGEPLQVRESVMGQSFSISPVSEEERITPENKVAPSINGKPAAEIFAEVKKRHGVTRSIYEAGYVLPDGTMLDFSGRADAGGFTQGADLVFRAQGRDYMKDQRGVDHREIEWQDMPEYQEIWEPMAAFLRLGAVRVDANSGMISMHSRAKITSAQASALKSIVVAADGAYIDLEDDARNRSSMQLNGGKWGRVNGLLTRWANGETPEFEGESFSISPIRNLNELSDQVARQFAENPVEALEVKTKVIRQFAKIADKWSNERWTPQGNKIRPISDKRTAKSLDKEQAMRQANAENELLANLGYNALERSRVKRQADSIRDNEEWALAKAVGYEFRSSESLSKEQAFRQASKVRDLLEAEGLDKTTSQISKEKDFRFAESRDLLIKGGMSEKEAESLAAASSKKWKADTVSKIKEITQQARDEAQSWRDGYVKRGEQIRRDAQQAADEFTFKEEGKIAGVEAARGQAVKEAQAWRDETDAMQKEDWSPKESLVRDLITLEAIVAMFPQEIRGKIGGFVTLARKASESARLKVLQKQLERGQVLLEKHLKEQYNVSLLKMLNKAAPVGKPGEVKKSKFIVTVQDELDAISEIVGMDSDDVTESIATNEAAIISAQTPEAADVALTRLNLLELFGGILDLKRTSSQEMEVAHEYLAKLMKQGREARKIIDEARSAKVKEMVTMAKADAFKGQTGPETTQAARAKAAKESGRAMLRKFFGELSGFDAVLRDAFGPKSETARSFSERFTLNSNDFEDVQNERRTRFRDFARELYQTKLGAKINQKLIKLERIEKNSSVTYLKNREVKTHKFTESDAAKIVADPKAFGFTDKDAAAISEEIQAIQDSGGRRKVFTYDQIINDGDRVEIPLSQMDAVYISMALRQPGILEQQERHGYDQQTVEELDKYLTDEAKAWRRWMQTEYDAEYQRANEVYMRMFNARMPMIMFYAPLLKNHQGQQAILDPLNTGISSNSANPGSIKTRKGRTSSLRIESALTVFWAHFNQMEYWIANAEYLRDVQAVLLNPEVRESVVASHGEDGMATISAWIQLQMSRGVGKAALATAGNKIFRNVKTGLTMKALALSYTTALKTLPSVFYSLGEIHMSKWPSALTSGMKHWNRLWKTNIIQRRLDIGGMPELRDLGSSAMPMSWMNQLIKYGSAPAMYADGVFTTFSAAMAYGVNYDEAIRQGASEDLAHKHAEERTALIVSRTAQPENWTQKSLLENDVGAFGSMFTLFMSDPRQKMALTGAALNQFRKGNVTGEEAARKFLAYWVIPGIMFQLANAIGRSLFKGDDDEWEVVDFATAALVGQLQGLVLLGSGVESIFSAAIAAAAEKITGEEVKRKPFWNSSKNPLDQAAQDLIKSAENLNDTDKDVFEKTWEVIKSAGMLTTWLNPAGAVPATVERVIKDTTNLFYGAEEK